MDGARHSNGRGQGFEPPRATTCSCYPVVRRLPSVLPRDAGQNLPEKRQDIPLRVIGWILSVVPTNRFLAMVWRITGSMFQANWMLLFADI